MITTCTVCNMGCSASASTSPPVAMAEADVKATLEAAYKVALEIQQCKDAPRVQA